MSNRIRTARQGERGFVLTLYTLMMLFIIIPMVGLAIDAGIMYMIKGKLQTAVDGAALGAARSLAANVSLGNQESNAGAAGIANYHANFPNNWMQVTPVNDPTVDWSQSTTYTAVVQITGTVAAPTWFMRIFGYNTLNVSATGTATRRNLNVVLVIDRSASLQLELVNGVPNCTPLIAYAQDFVNSAFVEGRDQVGLVTFGTSYNYDFAMNTTFKSSLTTALAGISPCQGFTNAAAGFNTGFSALKANTATNQFALNVLIFFTDGEPNTMTFGVNGTSAQTVASPNPASTSATYNPLSISPSSSCSPHTAGTKTSGVLAGDVTVGVWGGVLQWTNPGIGHLQNSDLNPYGGPPTGCSYASNYFNSTGDPNESFKNDITGLPTADAFGDSTTGTWPGGTNGNFPYHVVTTGNWYYMQNLENAGTNTLDNAAYNARVYAAAHTMPYVVYTIGLNPNIYGTVNQALLARVANDPLNNPVYSSTYAAGKFYYVPDVSQLGGVFQAIASDILRIAQ
jgi:Flp pilus assembly protein TadG